jgi:hypothetical protein
MGPGGCYSWDPDAQNQTKGNAADDESTAPTTHTQSMTEFDQGWASDPAKWGILGEIFPDIWAAQWIRNLRAI